MKKTTKITILFSLILFFAIVIAIAITYTFTTANSKNRLSDYKIGDYEKADFNKFNSTAEENGLGNTLIYLDGSFDSVDYLNGNLCYAFFTDRNKNKWLLNFGANTVDIEHNLANKNLRIFVLYTGFSELYDMPAIHLIRVTDPDTGFSYNYYDFLELPVEKACIAAYSGE